MSLPRCRVAALITIHINMYMDDLLKGVDSVREATGVTKQDIVLFNKLGFKLMKWASNDRNILSGFRNEKLPPNSRNRNNLKENYRTRRQWVWFGTRILMN